MLAGWLWGSQFGAVWQAGVSSGKGRYISPHSLHPFICWGTPLVHHSLLIVRSRVGSSDGSSHAFLNGGQLGTKEAPMTGKREGPLLACLELHWVS